MKYAVEISNAADADLRSIFEYIAYHLQSVQNACNQLNRIEESIAALEIMPHRFRQHEKEPWHSRGLRIMPVDNYLVFYIPNEEKLTVTIIRVMYGGRDVKKQLGEV